MTDVAPITVAIPIGPDPKYLEFLPDCLKSVCAQTLVPDEILIISDQSRVTFAEIDRVITPGVRFLNIQHTPWLVGVAHAFNFGVARASQDLVIMLGSDDKLHPWAVESCMAQFEKNNRATEVYYWMDVEYSDDTPDQSLPCNGAMVHKDLWRLNGGFPVESAVGAPDTILISMMLAAKGALGNFERVETDKPPYWYRTHDRTDTHVRGSRFRAASDIVRDVHTEGWQRRLEDVKVWTR